MYAILMCRQLWISSRGSRARALWRAREAGLATWGWSRLARAALPEGSRCAKRLAGGFGAMSSRNDSARLPFDRSSSSVAGRPQFHVDQLAHCRSAEAGTTQATSHSNLGDRRRPAWPVPVPMLFNHMGLTDYPAGVVMHGMSMEPTGPHHAMADKTGMIPTHVMHGAGVVGSRCCIPASLGYWRGTEPAGDSTIPAGCNQCQWRTHGTDACMGHDSWPCA